jgi:hypothetical protein
VGKDLATRIDLVALRAIDGIEVGKLGDGILVRVDPSAGPRRGRRYWDKFRAVHALVASRADRPTLVDPPSPGHHDLWWAERGRPPGRPGPAPTALIPRPAIARLANGRTHIVGARYERTRFAQLDFREPGAVVEGFEAVRCQFDNVAIGSVHDGEDPVTVRHCTLVRCRVSASIFRFIVLDESLIDGASGGFYPTATILLRHVTMRVAIDALDLRPPRQLRLHDRASLEHLHREHYRTVDWALDISEARFRRCDISGIPGQLVRRDPATQILVTRERVFGSRWREVTAGAAWMYGIERLLESGMESQVFVACPRGNRYQEELELTARLREAGIAVPD